MSAASSAPLEAVVAMSPCGSLAPPSLLPVMSRRALPTWTTVSASMPTAGAPSYVDQVPTTLRPDGRGRPPHLRTWRDGWRHLRFLLLFCPRWLFLYPGVLLLAFGLVGFGLLRQGGVQISFVGFGVHSLLYMAAATILGTQLIQLAVLTKWMGVLSRLVPKPNWIASMEKFVSLELGLLLGAGMLLGGFAWSVALVVQWSAAGFGPLDPARAMHEVIPAVTLMIVGTQAAAGALFAAALKACWPSTERTNDR